MNGLSVDSSKVVGVKPATQTSGEAAAPRFASSPSAPRRKSFSDLPALADARDGALGNFPLTEAGTAQRLLHRAGHDLRFVHEVGAWLIWTGARWEWDRDGAGVRRLTSNLSEQIYAEGARAPRGDDLHYLTWARRCQTQRTIRAIVDLASDQSELRCSIDDVDGAPHLVGIGGGSWVIDLREGAQRPAQRDDLVTRSLSASELGTASSATRWGRFLREAFEEDDALIGWLKRYLGYCLLGEVRESIFLFAFGAGANGKSVLFNTLIAIWGDYARTIQPETLMLQARIGAAPSPDIARLAGARLVLGSETEEGRPLAEALIKQLTGGDRVTARDMYSKAFEFQPKFKLLLSGNHRPRISGTDNGIWRRIRLLPFNRIFAPDQQDHGLAQALLEERCHIVAWLVEGCQAYLRQGLNDVPSAMAAATSAYREEEDIVGRWIHERTIEGGESLGAVLYGDYCAWAASEGYKPLSTQAFGRRLRDRGLEARHTRSGTAYNGISIGGVMM